jgi:hypothetical protein
MLPIPDDDLFVLHDLGGRTRHTWADKWDFLLTAAGFTLGLNNIWRFPYFCLQHEPGSSIATIKRDTKRLAI